MRVKVGDAWHELRIDQPLMIELTDADRENIAAMPPEATRYAIFHDDDPRSEDEQFEWMQAGDPKPGARITFREGDTE